MQNGLVIGKSQADSQLDYMTYIQKAKYPVVYEFVSGTHDSSIAGRSDKFTSGR